MTRLRTLQDWLTYIEAAHPRAWDLGLERVRLVAERLDVLPPAPRNVVVAGTNGKGSTSVYAEALLRATGLRVGTTLSPHLFAFNERIRIDGVAVDDATIVAAFEAIESARRDVTLTYFEYGILAALTTFRRARVDATVLEVGLGGRLDAVNIVDGDVCVITSIGLDHQDWLGDDTESIGAEKAGIMRAGVPCVFGESTPPASVVARARALGAPLVVRDDAFHAEREGAAGTWRFRGRVAEGEVTQTGLAVPAVALENAASALQAVLALGIDPERVREICAFAATAWLPGRLERRCYRGRDVLLDVAHNPHGARFLAAQLQARPIEGRTVAVMGCLNDKDAAGIVAALAGSVDDWTFVSTGSARGQSAEDTLAKVTTIVSGRALDDLAQALASAAARCGSGDRILVLGGFDVVQRATACVDSCRD
jgi:dihydrofolate synthase/folylpolyglutamate synthase